MCSSDDPVAGIIREVCLAVVTGEDNVFQAGACGTITWKTQRRRDIQGLLCCVTKLKQRN